MPAALTYPGVYVEEVPSGVRTIVGVATSITAFIGRAATGPINEATVINSFADFERTFGGLWLDSAMSFAVRDFFLNGGGQAVIVRLFHEPAAPAAPAGGGPAPTAAAASYKVAVGAWTFVAASPGRWGGNLRVRVQSVKAIDENTAKAVAKQMGLTPDDLFNVTVRDAAPGGRVEQFMNVSVKPGPRRIDRVLEEESQLVRWDGAMPSTPPASPITGTDTEATDDVWKLDKALAEAVAAKGPSSSEAKTAADALDAKAKTVLDALTNGDPLTKKDDFTPVGAEADKKGLYALEQLYATGGLFNLLCIPPYDGDGGVEGALIDEAAAYCEKRRAMLLVDAPAAWKTKKDARERFAKQQDFTTTSRNAAVFFPRLRQPNPLRDDQMETFAACGTVAGIFARTDTQRGVWKAPAGLDATLVAVPEFAVPLTDDENGELNPLGVNCLRSFPVYGRVVWGARTLRGADQLADEYKYIPVRRTALYIEESLYRGLKWVVFEPNDEPLWAQIRLNVGAFMHNLFRQGAFQGRSPREAYFVRCDSTTTTQNDINLGIVNIHVGFAPLKPAEFVVIKLQQIAGQIEV
jgi:phage tail sheath protein FI